MWSIWWTIWRYLGQATIPEPPILVTIIESRSFISWCVNTLYILCSITVIWLIWTVIKARSSWKHTKIWNWNSFVHYICSLEQNTYPCHTLFHARRKNKQNQKKIQRKEEYFNLQVSLSKFPVKYFTIYIASYL